MAGVAVDGWVVTGVFVVSAGRGAGVPTAVGVEVTDAAVCEPGANTCVCHSLTSRLNWSASEVICCVFESTDSDGSFATSATCCARTPIWSLTICDAGGDVVGAPVCATPIGAAVGGDWMKVGSSAVGATVGVATPPIDRIAVGVGVGVTCCATAVPKFESVPAAAMIATMSRAGLKRDTDAFLRCIVDDG